MTTLQAHRLANLTAERMSDQYHHPQQAAEVYHRTYRELYEQHTSDRCPCADCVQRRETRGQA